MSLISRLNRKGRALLIIAAGLGVAFLLQRNLTHHPSSDDASIDAEVIHVAAQVGGRIVEIGVEENEQVKAGDLLFRIDPEAYELAVAQAEANLDLALAALETRRRSIISESLAAKIAADQKQKAQTNLALSTRTIERLKPLAGPAYIPAQEFDQAQTTQKDAATLVQQASKQQALAEQNVGNDQGAVAAVKAAEAALALTKKALRDTEVRAMDEGRVVGLSVRAGETIAPSQSLFTLVTTAEWHAVANFRESELRHIEEGDCATVYSMIDRTEAIKGKVDGIGWGVMDSDRINLPRSAPFVEKSLNWVRVAQRFPVRVKLESPPEKLMRLGASAVVEIHRGAGCK